jgi:hypothetical protein
MCLQIINPVQTTTNTNCHICNISSSMNFLRQKMSQNCWFSRSSGSIYSMSARENKSKRCTDACRGIIILSFDFGKKFQVNNLPGVACLARHQTSSTRVDLSYSAHSEESPQGQVLHIVPAITLTPVSATELRRFR